MTKYLLAKTFVNVHRMYSRITLAPQFLHSKSVRIVTRCQGFSDIELKYIGEFLLAKISMQQHNIEIVGWCIWVERLFGELEVEVEVDEVRDELMFLRLCGGVC